MSKRLLILIMLASLPLAAAATETRTPDAEVVSPPATEAQVKKPTQCALVTGSRIRPSTARGCETPKPYRSYSAAELERSGETNLIEALRKLDPIFR